jgi:phage tail sheath protein FI
MPFQLSPGVNVSEIDLTTVIPAVSTTAGAFAGAFNWGPINKRTLITSEIELVNRFGIPDNNTAISFFSAANFLSYGNNLRLVRANATSANNAVGTSYTPLSISSEDVYESTYYTGNSNAGGMGPFAARYPGVLGNNIKVSICPGAQAFSSNVTAVASLTVTANLSNVLIATANVAPYVVSGDYVSVGSGYVQVASVSTSTIILTSAVSSAATGLSLLRKWEYADQFDGAPGTSSYASSVGGSNDQLHVIVVDAVGSLSYSLGGSYASGTILEKYPFASAASDGRDSVGSASYYKTQLYTKSKFVYWMNHLSGATNWGSTAAGTAFVDPVVPTTLTFQGGSYSTPTTANVVSAIAQFNSTEDLDISLIIGGDNSAPGTTSSVSDVTIPQAINDLATSRKDCVAFISPPAGAVINQSGNESANIQTWLNNLGRTSSYTVVDSGWKYQFDKYNNTYRYIPLNADIAGLCVRTDNNRDPWFSPAGFSRGQIKNIVKLAWNPNQANRDVIYKIGVNPVVTFPGQGTLLYGDKTLQSQPSAFDRINVRRLFIVLEKAISTAAKFSLFEFNDDFTRAQFVALVEPFLRDVKGRRGIYDYRVVCDNTNNTPQVIDSNQFVGDIYIKPARSINFIQLNFVAVRTGVDFTEVVGKF